MDFILDEFFEPVAAPVEREEVPEGEHEFRIVGMVEDDRRLRVDLAHDDRRYGLVFADLPKSQPWAGRIVGQLAAALGLDAAGWKAATAATLKDRRVRARVYHKAGRDGRMFVNVGGFSAAQAAAEPPKPVAKRTPTKKADAAAATVKDDEIPF
jgi:hypothetical protein